MVAALDERLSKLMELYPEMSMEKMIMMEIILYLFLLLLLL